MGCAASSTVNTADDIKPLAEAGLIGYTQSPKLRVDSGDLRVNETLDYGDQLDNNKIVEEVLNFHNSPSVIPPDSQSIRSSSKSLTNTNKLSESLKFENVNSKYDDNKFKMENCDNISNSSSPISKGLQDKVYSRISVSDRVGDVKIQHDNNFPEDIKENNTNLEKVYNLISPQESILSSHHSNIIYKPTSSSDDEIKASNGNSTNINESNEEIIHLHNSRSVMSDSKTVQNKAEEYWNQEIKLDSNANSMNNFAYEKSSRNSHFSHTYTGSIHSPFFDSLNHGNTNYDIEENQNHDEVTETINERVILGTGDSEHWVSVNQNYRSDLQNVSSSKSNNPESDKKTHLTNLSARGDKTLEHLEQSNDDNTLDIDNNHIQNDVAPDDRRTSESQSFDMPDTCAGSSVNIKQLTNESMITLLKNDLLKTAVVNDSKYEGILIRTTSTRSNFEVGHTREQFTIMDAEETMTSKDESTEF